jgi:serine/threonine-protein kinase
MTTQRIGWLVVILAGAAWWCLVLGPARAQPSKEELAAKALAVVNKHCLSCHNKDNAKKDLDLLNPVHLADAERRIVVPKSPKESELMRRVLNNTMPPANRRPRLEESEKKALSDWIAAGAPAFDLQLAAKVPAKEPFIPPTSSATTIADVFTKHCVDCHGGAKPDGGFAVRDLETLHTKKIVMAGKPNESPLYQRIVAGEDSQEVMPPQGEGRARMSPEEVEVVRRWIADGAKSIEEFVKRDLQREGDAYVLREILRDVREAKTRNEQVEFYRYLSLNHLPAAGITEKEMEAHRQALTLVVNSLSWMSDFEIPKAIEPTKTVYRVDISKLGWHAQPFRKVERDAKGDQRLGERSTLRLWDLVLLEYPYGVILDTNKDFVRLVDEFLEPSKQVLPIPFVRGDWFINVAGRPPLYDDLLQLPFKLSELEQRLEVKIADNIEQRTARRAGVTASGVSKNNRVVERHDSPRYGYFWLSYDFASSKGPQNMFRNPIDFTAAGGEMIWGLPNGLQGYMVTTSAGDRLDAAPTEIVTDRFASDQTVRNGLACIRCHDNGGIKRLRDDVRPVLERFKGESPQFDKNHALDLYVERNRLEELLDKDSRRYADALKRLFGDKQPSISYVLDVVSARFLDRVIKAHVAAAEVANLESDNVEKVFNNRDLATGGLLQLAFGGGVRRDAWEDTFDQVVRGLNVGKPLVPIDALTRLDYGTNENAEFDIQTRDAETGRVKTTFIPGDKVKIVVKNRSKGAIFIEVVGTDAQGFKWVFADQNARVEPEKEFVVAHKGSEIFEVGAQRGRELVTVFACDQKFPRGELIRLPREDDKGRPINEGKACHDRFVHPFLKFRRAGDRVQFEFDPKSIVKKTLEISTQ